VSYGSVLTVSKALAQQTSLPIPLVAPHAAGVTPSPQQGRGKRRADTDSEAVPAEHDVVSPVKAQHTAAADDGAASMDVSGPAADTAKPVVMMADFALNFPLPGPGQVAVMVKVYDALVDQLRMGDVLDVIGVLSLDDVGGDTDDEFGVVAQRSPASILPRLHAILVDKLVSVNPLVSLTEIESSASCRRDSAVS